MKKPLNTFTKIQKIDYYISMIWRWPCVIYTTIITIDFNRLYVDKPLIGILMILFGYLIAYYCFIDYHKYKQKIKEEIK